MNHEQIAKNLSDGIDAALFEQYGAEWKRRALQAERDRDTLAAEVEAWRYDVPCDTTDLVASDGTLTRLGELVKLTDASGALTRAK